MMRKLIHIVVLLIYFIAIEGVPVYAHYCMGDLQYYSLGEPEKCCGEAPPMDCCTNDVDLFQLSGDQEASSIFEIDFGSVSCLFFPVFSSNFTYTYLLKDSFNDVDVRINEQTKPPIERSLVLTSYAFICVFRIGSLTV